MSTSSKPFLPSLRRRYYRPHEAAEALGTDAEAIRQAVLHFDGEPERIPLFFETRGPTRVLWRPRLIPDPHYEPGVVFKSEHRIDPETGLHEWWEATVGRPEMLLSKEFTLSAGLWFELDPMHCHDLGADPHARVAARWLHADALGIGPIPSKALIHAFDGPAEISFADCWIAAADVERLSAALPVAKRAPKEDIPGTLAEWEAAPWASTELKAAIWASLGWAGCWERNGGTFDGCPTKEEMVSTLQENHGLTETAAKRVATVIRPGSAPAGRPPKK